jgi:chitodextrinase
MIDLFLKWNAEDPVSQIEIDRNTYHENTANMYAQGNRNPFIDNPYLATRIWGGDSAEDRWGIYLNSDTEAPTVPADVTVNTVTLTSIGISWSASTDNVDVTGYEVFVNNVLTEQTASTSITLEGLSTSTAYTFNIVAKDLVNNKSAKSASVSATTLSDTETPTVPMNAAVSNETDSSFKISWEASSDNVGVTGYDVYLDNTFQANISDLSYTFTGLSTSTSYTASVLSIDAANNKSARSNIVNATTTDGASNGVDELFISEYLEGKGGTNKAIEIVNLTSSTVDLAGYVLKIERNGAGVWTTPLSLNRGDVKSIVPGDVFVVGNGDNSFPELQPYTTNNTIGEVDLVQLSNSSTTFGQPVNFNGNDAVGLFKDDVLIDIIGVFGNDAIFAEDITLRRKSTITTPSSTFDMNEWDSFAENTVDGIGSHVSTLSTTANSLESFKMYPNPTNGNTVYFNITENVSIKVYSILGKLIDSKNSTQNKNTLDISSLSKGVYLVRVTNGEKTVSRKLVKN